ncbi:SdrD B-like domain-containing protein [Schleiferilactobacillus shenzhenensis]|nr:SdrD B-like domain-containing protein [Schleiferilactobacillus shenzhenensis]
MIGRIFRLRWLAVFSGVLLLAGLLLPGSQPQHAQAAAGILQSTSFGPTIDGTTATFDSNNDPGNDSSSDNGIVRAWDSIITRASLTFDPTDAPYDVTFTLSGTLGNGLVDKVQNAGFPDTVNGTADFTAGTVSFSTTKTFHVTANNNTDVVNVPIDVYGAKNGTVLTPHLHAHVTKWVDSKGTAHTVDVSQDITTPADSDSRSSFTVSSKVNLGVVLVNVNGSNGLRDFNTYAKATGAAQKKAVIGVLNFGVGLKPLAGRGHSFLGAAYPDPGSAVTVNLATSATLNNTALDLTTPMQTFQVGPARQDLTTVPLFASQYPNAPTSASTISTYMPSGSGALTQAGPNIDAVIDSGTLTAGSAANALTYQYSGWSAGGVSPNNSGGNSNPSDPWATQTKLFLSSAATIILPLDQYTKGDALNFVAQNSSVNYVDDGKTVTEGAADLAITSDAATLPTKDGNYGASVNWNYSDSNAIGHQSLNAILRNAQGQVLSTDDWKADDAAAYTGETVEAQMHLGLFDVNATGADAYQFWNPNESHFDDSVQPFTYSKDANGDPLKPTFYYGISKTGKYTLADLTGNTGDSYTWYATAKEAEAHGAISGIKCVYTQALSPLYQTDYYYDRTIVSDHYGTAAANGDPYLTVSRSVTYYGDRTDTSTTAWYPWGSYNYTPAAYTRAPSATDQTSAYTAPTNTYQIKRGNNAAEAADGTYPVGTLLVEPYLTRIDDFSANAKTYDMGDTAACSLTPDIQAGSSAQTTGVITLTVTLPKGVHSSDVTMGGKAVTPALKENTDGTTTMTITLDHPKPGVQPTINFNLTFDQMDIDFGTNVYKAFSIPAVISSPDDASVVALRTKNLDINVNKETALIADKKAADGTDNGTMANTAIVERNSPFKFQVQVRNDYSKAYTTNVLDRLPSNGEKGSGTKASQFTGGYSIDKIVAGKGSGKIWYTYDPAFTPDGSGTNDADAVYQQITAGTATGDAQWYSYTPGAALPYDENKPITAILFREDSLPVGSNDLYTMYYTPRKTKAAPDGNYAGDVYANLVSYRRTPTGDPSVTDTAEVDVVNRTIKGNVWHDVNGDGLRIAGGTTEPGIANFHVHLWDVSGSTPKLVTKDLNGQDITNVTTDKDGNYSLTHLAAGKYRVGFSQASMSSNAGTPTTMNADPNDLANSSALDPSLTATDAAAGGTDYLSHAVYTLPDLSAMAGTTGYVVANVNAGFTTAAGTLSLTHVPNLYFGKHAIPQTQSVYQNTADPSTGATAADNTLTISGTYQEAYHVTASMSTFKTSDTAAAGLAGASIDFSDPVSSTITSVDPVVAGDSAVTIFNHTGIGNNPEDVTFKNIQLTIPTAGTTGILGSQYQATVTYGLNLGL